jgi:hypothetical protein
MSLGGLCCVGFINPCGINHANVSIGPEKGRFGNKCAAALSLRRPLGSCRVIVFVCTGGPYAKPCHMLGRCQGRLQSSIVCYRGLVDSADETMSMFNCAVPRSEADLMGR